MEKKFIPLNSKTTSVSNPFQVRTWELPEFRKKSISPESIEKPFVKNINPQSRDTNEDLVHAVLTKISRASSYKRAKKACAPHDSYVECVRLQRRQKQIKQHAKVREKIIQIREQLREPNSYIEKENKWPEDYDLIKFASIPSIAQVKQASPSPSTDVVFVPSRKLLDLKKPKSGIFVNETPSVEPRPTPIDYNPRNLQSQLEQEYSLFEVANVNGEEIVRLPNEQAENSSKQCYCLADSRNIVLKQTNAVPEKTTFLHLNVDTCSTENLHIGRPNLQNVQEEKRDADGNQLKDAISLKLFAEFKCEKDLNADKTSRQPEEIAAIFAAYAYNFIQPAHEWNMSTMLQIMNLGKFLHEKSVKINYKRSDSDFDIDDRLIIQKVPLEINCGTPAFIGTLNGTTLGVSEALRDYFQDKIAGIFICEDTFLLIWKQCKSYYIFDPSGRERQTLKLNNKEGCASLLTCLTLHGVVDLIANRCGFQSNAIFKLYEINLKSFNLPLSVRDEAPDVKPKKHYVIVHKHFALIRGSDGLPTSAKTKLNPSILISCLARIYSDIHPARFWSKSIIDQLRKYALGCYMNQCKKEKLKAYNISNLPKVHRLGSYRTEIKISPFETTGQMNQCPNFRSSQFASALCSFFEKYDIALVQVDLFTIAIWKDPKFFYVFDPFRRSLAGLADTGGLKGAACLQIHLTLRSMCSIVYNNAQAMATAGNFFIHGIEIVKTRIAHHSNLKNEKVTFPLLLLDYPVKCDFVPPNVLMEKALEESLSKSLLFTKFLSELSVAPCERACSETEIMDVERKEKIKLRKMSNISTKHIESAVSLPASEKIDWFDSYDVVLPIVNTLLEKFFNSIYEPEKVSRVGKARKVLLQSDKDNLEALIKTVERGYDYDNLHMEFRTSPDIYNYVSSMEEELKVPTSFEIMPDGSWIVSGSNLITENKADVHLGSLSAFIAMVMASQYNIKFWNCSLIDYIRETANILRDSDQFPKNSVAFLLNGDMPDIHIKEKVLGISVERLGMGPAHNLHEIIENSLQKNNDLILLSNTFSCTIFRRNVFYFLFIGHPCDIMGFRSSNTGVPSLVRTIDLESTIHRILANLLNSKDDQNVVVLGLKVRERKQDFRFMRYSPSDEELVYSDEKGKLEGKENRKQMKILFLKDQLAQERKRVEDFRRSKFGSNALFVDDMEEEEFMLYEVDTKTYPIPKHYPIGHYPLIEPVRFDHEDNTKRRPELGYGYYQPDYNFKIQGTTALEDRKTARGTHIVRPCYFVSMYAIMLAIHKPLEKWDFRRVDVAVENGIQMDNLTTDKNTCPSRKLKNIIIDDKIYGLEVKQYVINQTLIRLRVYRAIRRLLNTRKYFLIQFENTTFAVYKDAYFHLFDPYKTLDKIKESNNQNKPIRLKEVKPLQDRNTASWITFPNLEYMLTYVEERMTSSNWKEDFNLFVINILWMKKALRNEKLTQMLTSTFALDEPKTEFLFQSIKMQTEKVTWLEMFNGVVPWSPLTSVNLDNEKRGMPSTKWKSFDLELLGRLMSLWGHIHPKSVVFGVKRGKQCQAISVMACCMALVYQVEEWTPNIINSIVVYGDKYFESSTKSIKLRDYEFSLEDLDTQFSIGKLCDFDIHLESIVYGLLYETKPKVFNLSRALSFFFVNYTFGVIQCMRKSLCFGKTQTGFFLFDCESYGKPLFESNQGCAYVLLASNLDVLLYCIVMTLRIPYYNIEFVIHAVTPSIRAKETTKKPMPQPVFAPAQSSEQSLESTKSSEDTPNAEESALPPNTPASKPEAPTENEPAPAEDTEERELDE